jgi:primosomal replication protein N
MTANQLHLGKQHQNMAAISLSSTELYPVPNNTENGFSGLFGVGWGCGVGDGAIFEKKGFAWGGLSLASRSMASVNKVIIIGNCTRDPELRYTPKGTAVTDLGLAMNRSFASDGGERREETTFVDVTLWGRTAEIAKEYLSKGRQVYIEGRLQMDSWEDKTSGQKRSKLKIVGEQMTLLGSR